MGHLLLWNPRSVGYPHVFQQRDHVVSQRLVILVEVVSTLRYYRSVLKVEETSVKWLDPRIIACVRACMPACLYMCARACMVFYVRACVCVRVHVGVGVGVGVCVCECGRGIVKGDTDVLYGRFVWHGGNVIHAR